MTIESLIARLAEVDRDRGSDYVADYEAILAEMSAIHDPAIIKAVTEFLNDDSQFDELMFSIIHLIERFETSVYVDQLLEICTTLYSRSPRWTRILFVRILNSEDARLELIRCLPDSPRQTKKTIAAVMDEIRGRNSQFLAKIASVLPALE